MAHHAVPAVRAARRRAIVRLLALLLLLVTHCARAAERIWIDADAACDGVGRTDVDDCWAIALLARAPGVEVVGISTVFGNAPGPRVLAATRALVQQLDSRAGIPVWRGAEGPLPMRPLHQHAGARNPPEQPPATPALTGLRRALAAGPIRIVALGPLTNIAQLLAVEPLAARNVTELLAVMGKREGHVFHPAEDAQRSALLGHGPIFTDMNLRLDPAAAAFALQHGLPMRLFPYELARQVTLRPDAVAPRGPLATWLATRSRAWTEYWRTSIGRDGFYPFDALAAAYVLTPSAFTCSVQDARVAADTRIGLFGGGPPSLLVGASREAAHRVRYCTRVRPAAIHALWPGLR